MIYQVVETIRNKANIHLNSHFQIDEKVVVISHINNQGGLSSEENENKILMTVLGISREYAMGVNYKSTGFNDIMSAKKRPPIHMNFNIVFSANFQDKNYEESLKYISAIIEFIQVNGLLASSEIKNKQYSIEKINLEIINMSIQELSNVWSILGGKYLPSIICQVRMLTIDANEVSSTHHHNKEVVIN